MALRFRKPQLIPLLFIIAATVLLVGLGSWQLQRMQWKNNLLAQVNDAATQPVLGTLPESLEGLEFRKVALTGAYLPSKTLRFIGRKAGGYVYLTPFKLEDTDKVIMVSRGWFADEAGFTVSPGVQTVEGMLRAPRHKRHFSPDNAVEKNIWFTEDVPAMSEATGVNLVPMVVDTEGLPTLTNDHLGYAITWFLLAVIGLVMFAVYHRER